jgi:hypothetical protein
MGEAQEVEGPRSTPIARLGSLAPERNETGLLRMETKPILRKTLRQYLCHTACILLVCKDEYRIVRKADH